MTTTHAIDGKFAAICCLLCALFGGSPVIIADAPPATAYRKIAVIGSPQLQKSGLTDLVSMRLQNAGVRLIRRVKLEEVDQERELSAALGARSPKERANIASPTGADALVLMHEESAGPSRYVRVIVAERRQGARLSSDLFPLDAPAEEVADKIAAAVARTRRRFAGGIKGMVAVLPFMSDDFTYEFHPFQAGYPTLLQEALNDVPGLAVMEVEEARAIRHELDVAGPTKAQGIVPVFVEGKYEVTHDAANAPRVLLKIVIGIANRSRTIEKGNLTLEAASKFVSRELPAEIMPDFRAGAAKPFSADAEFARVVARADAFAALGEWDQAAALRQAALVINPDSATQRAGVVNETVQLLLANTFTPEPPRDEVIAILVSRWQAALVSLEWEIRHDRNSVPVSRVSTTLFAGLSLARGSTSSGEAQRLKRDFVQHVFPLLWDSLSKTSVPNTPAHPRWFCVDQLMRIAVYGGPGALTSADYNILLDLLEESVPPEDEPSSWVMDFLWSPHAAARARRLTRDFSAFLLDLKKSRRSVNRIMADIALIYSRVEKGEPVDAATLRQINDLQHEYVSLHLTPIPGRHEGVLDVLARLQKPAAPHAVVRQPATHRADVEPEHLTAALQLANQEPIIRSGVLQFKKFALRQKRRDGSVVYAKDGIPSQIRGVMQFVRCGDTLDVAWDPFCLNLVREPGLLEVVWDTISTPTFGDVKWDGEHIWIATLNDGIWVVDTDGNVLVKIKEALMPADQQLRLSVLGPDRIVAAGSFGPANRAWVAMIEMGAKGYTVKILLETTRIIEPNYHVGTTTLNDKDLAFAPSDIGVSRSVNGKHVSIVIRREGFGVGRVLLIDADTRAVTAPNIPLQYGNFSVSGGWVLQILRHSEIALWRPAGNGTLDRELAVSLPAAKTEPWRMVTSATSPDSAIYVVGAGWYQIDPRKKSARRLCPDAPLGDFRVGGAIDSHLGLIMWGRSQGRYDAMYRVTVDEKNLRALPD